MNCLRSSCLLAIFVFNFLNFGCVTSYFKIKKQTSLNTEIFVSPDRVQLECEKVSSENELYGFTIHILDQNNVVIPFIQANTVSIEYCEFKKSKIQKILDQGKQIYIGGRGDFTLDPKGKTFSFYFPGHGTFKSNKQVIQFIVISNEKGGCLSAYYDDQKPCPRDEFP